MTQLDPRHRRRYERQIRLADVGERGQAKLCAAKVAIGSQGFARTIEHRYVVSAGMSDTDADPTVDPALVDRVAIVEALWLRHPAARDVAEGALRARAAVRLALGDGA